MRAFECMTRAGDDKSSATLHAMEAEHPVIDALLVDSSGMLTLASAVE